MSGKVRLFDDAEYRLDTQLPRPKDFQVTRQRSGRMTRKLKNNGDRAVRKTAIGSQSKLVES
jgi:hypothetical protein